MQADLETIRVVGSRLCVSQGSIGIEIRGAAHALPVCHGTACWTRHFELIETTGGSVVAVIVAGHDHDRFFAARKIPEAWQGLPVGIHFQDQIGEQPLLFVGLRNRDLTEIDPVRLGITDRVTIEFVIRTDRRESIALLRGPCRIALAGVNDGGSQVVGKRRGLATVGSNTSESQGRIGGGGCCGVV